MGRTSKNIKLRIPEKLHKIKGFRSGSYRVATTISSPVDREVFLRFYFYCQKTAAIAADMALNESTVRTKLNRGRAKLRDFLIREGHDEKDEKGGAAWNTTSMI